MTRPDICEAVGSLTQHLENPLEMHWRAAVRVLRYLKGTTTLGIKFHRKQQNEPVVAYCDVS